jgi:hypothetical protein
MHTIFVGGITTGRFAMGSNELLGTLHLLQSIGQTLRSPRPSSSMARTSLFLHHQLEERGRGVLWLRMSSRPSPA